MYQPCALCVVVNVPVCAHILAVVQHLLMFLCSVVVVCCLSDFARFVHARSFLIIWSRVDDEMRIDTLSEQPDLYDDH